MYDALANLTRFVCARSAFPVKLFDRSRSGFQLIALWARNDFHGPLGQALLPSRAPVLSPKRLLRRLP